MKPLPHVGQVLLSAGSIPPQPKALHDPNCGAQKPQLAAVTSAHLGSMAPQPHQHNGSVPAGPQVQPGGCGSCWQDASQPSLDPVLPSSHSSPVSWMLLPQIGVRQMALFEGSTLLGQ